MRGRELGVAARLGLFAAALVIVFGAAFGVGAATGPDEADTPPTTTTVPDGPTTTNGGPGFSHGHDMEVGS